MTDLLNSTNKQTNRSTTWLIAALLIATFYPAFAFAWLQPVNLREENDVLRWDSDAPSYNIYENGSYIATVHGENSFEPIYENNTYRVAAHDRGTGFTGLSGPYLHLDVDSADDGKDSPEESFKAFELYFEVNNTDGDIGVHSFLDGTVWKQLRYLDVNDRPILDITLIDGLADQGITELFFESAEPTFDELSPSVFFSRFPSGTYEAEGISIDNTPIDSETELSHVIPAAPMLYVGENPVSSVEGCEDEESSDIIASLDSNGDLLVTWDPITSHHPVLGVAGTITVDGYQFVYESSEYSLTVDLEAEQFDFVIPASLINVGDVVKVGVLVRDVTHNQVGSEVCVLVL